MHFVCLRCKDGWDRLRAAVAAGGQQRERAISIRLAEVWERRGIGPAQHTRRQPETFPIREGLHTPKIAFDFKARVCRV